MIALAQPMQPPKSFSPRFKLSPKRVVAGVAAVLAIGFLALNWIAYRQAYSMMHFTAGNPRTGSPEELSRFQKIKVLLTGVNLPRPNSGLGPENLGPGSKKVTISGPHGVRLGAWYCPNATNTSLVIFFHGYGGDKTGSLPEAKAFLEMGFSVLLMDFRGSGDSSESYTTVGFDEAEDVAAAVRYARENLVPKRIILYGQSMGAVAVLRAVHAHGVEPDAIVAEAVFDTMLNTVRNRFYAMGLPLFPGAELLVFWGGHQAGFNGFQHNPVDYAASVRCPILFLHGDADPRAHLDQARRVFNAVPAHKEFKSFPGLGHESCLSSQPAQWKATLRQFLQANALSR